MIGSASGISSVMVETTYRASDGGDGSDIAASRRLSLSMMKWQTRRKVVGCHKKFWTKRVQGIILTVFFHILTTLNCSSSRTRKALGTLAPTGIGISLRA